MLQVIITHKRPPAANVSYAEGNYSSYPAPAFFRTAHSALCTTGLPYLDAGNI